MTSQSGRPLFTLAEFKEDQQITEATHDAQILSLARRVADLCARACNRPDGFWDSVDNVVEFYDGSGNADLWLKRGPVISVESVKVDASRAFASGTELASSEFFISGAEVPSLRLLPGARLGDVFGSESLWPVGSGNVRVSYRAGWDPIPEGLKQAAILWAASLFGGRTDGVIAESIGDVSRTYANASSGSGGVPNWALRMLLPYKMPLRLRRVSRS